MDKREQIERALMPVFDNEWEAHPDKYDAWWMGDYTHVDNLLDALAKQAIVIECEVEHRGGVTLPARTLIRGVGGYWPELLGHHGTPGKALAIIVPLEEE